MSPWEAAELLVQLPASSRVAHALNPGTEWCDERVYLARLEFWVHALIWGMSKRSRRGDRPEPLVPKALRADAGKRQIRGVARPIQEIDALFPIKSQ